MLLVHYCDKTWQFTEMTSKPWRCVSNQNLVRTHVKSCGISLEYTMPGYCILFNGSRVWFAHIGWRVVGAQQVIYFVVMGWWAQGSKGRRIKREEDCVPRCCFSYPKAARGNSFHPVGHRNASPDIQCQESRGKHVLVLSRTLVTIPVERLSFFKREN